jgi:hypothetical protein
VAKKKRKNLTPGEDFARLLNKFEERHYPLTVWADSKSLIVGDQSRYDGEGYHSRVQCGFGKSFRRTWKAK